METSLVTLQACQLIGCLSLAEADAATEAICSAIACRVVQLLDLPRRLSSNSLERELEIRGKTAFAEGKLRCRFREATTDAL